MQRSLIRKIETLSPERAAEVENVDFLRQRDDDRQLSEAASRLSEDAFRRVWDNEDDAVYDDLSLLLGKQ